MPVNVVPNTVGEGIRRASDNIFQAVLAKKERELKTRELDIRDQDQAMKNLLSVVPFLPEDATVESLPFVKDLLGRAVPEFQGQDLSALIPNKESLSSFLQTAAKEMYKDRGVDDPDFQRLLGAVTGLGATTVAERDATSGANIATSGAKTSQAEILQQSFRTLTQSPELMENIARTQFGQDPVFKVDLGGGQSISFDSNKAADLWLGLQRLSLEGQDVAVRSQGNQIDLMRLNAEEMEKSRKALMGIAGDLGVGLSKENADKMISAYQNSVGQGTEEWNQLWDTYQKAGDSDSLQLMSAMVQSVRTGAENINNILGQSDAGRTMLAGIAIQNALAESLPKDVVPEQMSSFMRSLEDNGVSIGLTSEKTGIGGIMGSRVWRLKGAPDAQAPIPDMEALKKVDPQKANDVQVAINLLARGQSAESLALALGQDVVDMALQFSQKKPGGK